MAEVLAARFGFCRPGQPDLLLKTGEACAPFQSRQMFI
jgi:hypothetical protein